MDEERRFSLAEIEALLSADPDSYTVMNCCICYGGNSFTGPMEEALRCHLEILRGRLRELGASEFKAGVV